MHAKVLIKKVLIKKANNVNVYTLSSLYFRMTEKLSIRSTCT